MTSPADSLPPDVVDAWRQGNKIEAIKRLRMATGLGLAEAKAAVEALERGAPGAGITMAARKPADRAALAPGEMPRAKGGLWAAALVILVLVLAGWLYTALA